MTRAFALAAIALAGGCELIADIPNPTVLDPLGGSDGSVDSMQEGCTNNAGCTMVGKPVCDLMTHTCGGCLRDNECPSNVCLMDGTCADAARFVYAAAGGTDRLCTMAMPCTVDTAVTMLTAEKDIVKLAPGVYSRDTTLTMSIAGTIAGGGSTFNVAGSVVGTYGIVAEGVPIRVIGLAMNVATSNMAVRCLVAGGEIHLARMTITGANGAVFSQCPTEIDRTTITGATLYGVYVNGATSTVQIRNSYITRVGTDVKYPAGAVHLMNVPSGTIEHVTIANNGSEGPSGLRCPGSGAVTIRNIIAWGNVAPGVDGACVVTNSIVDPGYVGGSANNSMDPMFINATAGNFHLMTSSPAARKGTTAAMFGIDGDGEDRPQPPASDPDPGADEIP